MNRLVACSVLLLSAAAEPTFAADPAVALVSPLSAPLKIIYDRVPERAILSIKQYNFRAETPAPVAPVTRGKRGRVLSAPPG
jgi:regulator of extracellular matrix RemA (YlzA/DUF370 family)